MCCKMRGMLWPAILVALGIMWLLSELHVLNHHGGMTIAVLFIVVGGVKLLQSSASTEGHIPPVMPVMAPPPVATGSGSEVHHG